MTGLDHYRKAEGSRVPRAGREARQCRCLGRRLPDSRRFRPRRCYRALDDGRERRAKSLGARWRVLYCQDVAGTPGITWLAECSAVALGEALQVVAPELGEYPVTVPGPAGKQDPQWHSGSVPVGERFFVKFA